MIIALKKAPVKGRLEKSFVPGTSAPAYFPKGGLALSIIGADAFHDSVRDGKRWFHIARGTEISGTNSW